MPKYWPFGPAGSSGSAYLDGLHSILAASDIMADATGMAQRVLGGDYADFGWNDTYSGGTSAQDYARRYPVLATAAGIHNLQLLQMMIAGVEMECYCDVKDGKGGYERLPENKPRLLRMPCPWDEAITMEVINAQAIAADVLCGEIYIFKHLTKRMNVEGIQVVPNHLVQKLDYHRGAGMYQIDDNDYQTGIRGGWYDSRNILHIITRPALGYTRGVGSQQMATNSVISALMVDVFSSRYYKNALSLGGIIMTRGKTEAQIKKLEKRLAAKFKGVEDAHRWMMFNSEEMDVRQLSPTPANAHLIRAGERAAIEIGKITNTPPTLANESIVGALSYAIAGAQDVQIAKNRLQPFGKVYASGLNRNSETRILPRGKDVRFVMEHLLRGDERSRAMMIGKMIKDSIISINQANRMMELPVYEGENYDEPIAPMNWVPVSKLDGTAEAEADGDPPEIDEDKLAAIVDDLVREIMATDYSGRNGYNPDYDYADAIMEA